jgi:uncharacterized protein
MANPFVHVELNTTDVDRAKAFYGKLFNWEMKDMPLPVGTYTMVDVGKGTGGGIMTQLMPDTPSMWLPYVSVDDIDAATKKARSLGAEIMKASQEVPDMGWLTIFTDPTGAILGLWEPKMEHAARRRTTTTKSRTTRRRTATSRRRR